MYRTIKKISLGSMNYLNPVVHKWQKLMDVDFWDYKNDAPWWYNERALLSLFAGAVWKCKDGWAFEEFATDKWKATKGGNKKKRKSRGDIMFGIEKRDFVAEAKQCWPIITNTSNGKEAVIEALSEACLDSSCLRSGYEHLGIVFVVPRIHESKRRNATEILKKFLSLFSSLKSQNIAVVSNFPTETRTLKGGDGYIYPGIVLMLKHH